MKYLILFFSLTFTFNVLAQNSIQSITPSFTPVPSTQNAIDTLVKITLTLNLQNTTVSDIKKIHLKAGSSQGANDKFQYAFVFDVTTGLPADVAYSRPNNGSIIYLAIGDYFYEDFFYEAKLELSDGSCSPVAAFH